MVSPDRGDRTCRRCIARLFESLPSPAHAIASGGQPLAPRSAVSDRLYLPLPLSCSSVTLPCLQGIPSFLILHRTLIFAISNSILPSKSLLHTLECCSNQQSNVGNACSPLPPTPAASQPGAVAHGSRHAQTMGLYSILLWCLG